MRKLLAVTLLSLSAIAFSGVAEAQGIPEGMRRGANEGNRVGGPVGGVLGGAVGGAVGGAAGVLGVDPGRRGYRTSLPSRRGYHRHRRHRHHH
ncbi:hypothetical protein [Methylobacterium organophilum]|uniref:Uncharacterized protein n=1 Tax=Methylobacterium organophilum TaxID=410 RepID=A0ABQ4T5J6_METOR|nr:hypothetical protein [Methylobacterium organophilum]UMY18948.1 hypothetical protein MMB17_06490 [Methylobacterium organophilum]GJE25525.1 hypothetical protein LKMONMHP_0363 [Methylobacterium organophilum]